MTTQIKDYALIGNCETAALIAPNGDIDWLCLPSFDSPSVFCRLLDREKGGALSLHPTGSFQVAREYLADSAILQTHFTTDQGVVRLTDFFVLARESRARFYDFTSLHSTRKLVRLAELMKGSAVEMEIAIEARPDYARRRPVWKEAGSGHFRLEEMALFTNSQLSREGEDISGKFVVTADTPLFIVADYSAHPRSPELRNVRHWLAITAAFWREWNLFNYYKGAHRKLVRRSAVTLKLLTHASTGAFVAAPTTSLPEGFGGELNWDYRFTWLRDTSLFIQTLFGLGYSGEAKAFLDYAVRKWTEKEKSSTDSDQPTVDVLYPVGDHPIPPETFLDHLAGYQNSRPVRIGNRATEQFQLDNYGHILQSLFYYRHTGGRIDVEKQRMIKALAAEAMRFWRRDDNGIWEEPDLHEFTYGKVMCWVALQRARDLLGDEDGAMAQVCAEIRTEIMTRCLTSDRSEQFLSAKLNKSSLDASSLLAFTTGFLPEPVAKPTRAAIERKLARAPFLYRSEGSDQKEGAFLLCSFWWINHLILEGNLPRAEELLMQIIEKVSPLGLLSEEIDPGSGEFLGNFPQAFSHLGLIQSILNLEGAKKRPGFHRLADHEKFQRTVGATVGIKGVIAGFFRVPQTFSLLFSSKSKWRE